MNYLEIGATIAGLLQGILVMFNKRSNWIAYVLQMILMVLFSLSVHLYGDAFNSSLYIIVGIVGFIIWNKKDEKYISECSLKERIIYLLVMLVGTVLVYFRLSKTNDPLPLIDAFTTVSSLVATYYMMVKKIDTWFIWFINDIFYCATYLLLEDQAIYLFLLNLAWTVMAVVSYINWKKIMKSNKKKVYFAGKFNLNKDKTLGLAKRLENDFRARILGDSKLMTKTIKNLSLSDKVIYSGPFYCEEASNGDFTSTDCDVVLTSEYNYVKECDTFVVVFDQNFSVGSVVELDWAVEMKKNIVIFYEEEESNYDIKSEYWFSICNALKKSKKVNVIKFKNINEVVKTIKKGEIFCEV